MVQGGCTVQFEGIVVLVVVMSYGGVVCLNLLHATTVSLISGYGSAELPAKSHLQHIAGYRSLVFELWHRLVFLGAITSQLRLPLN